MLQGVAQPAVFVAELLGVVGGGAVGEGHVAEQRGEYVDAAVGRLMLNDGATQHVGEFVLDVLPAVDVVAFSNQHHGILVATNVGTHPAPIEITRV